MGRRRQERALPEGASVLLVLLLAGCWISPSDWDEWDIKHGEFDTAEVEGDTDSDADGDSDTDADADSDADSDSDSDTDTDVPVDGDGDGWTAEEDCDDGDAEVNPEADEVCDEVDNDCDELVDDDDDSVTGQTTWYLDGDGDDYGLDETTTSACEQPSGYAALGGDCHDSDASVNPGASEVCGDAVDNDCDGTSEGCPTISGDLALSTADAMFAGEETMDNAGTSVSSAGDTNGDGFDDLLVGASGNDEGGTSAGAAYLVLGPVTGDLDLGSADAKFIGDDSSSAGYSVAGAGDVDGDGLDDVLVGATGAGVGGGAYLIFGPVTGSFGSASVDVLLSAESESDGVGTSVSGAGDVDGDGNVDLLIGAYSNDAGGSGAGAAYLVLGPVTANLGLGSAAAKLIGEAADDWAGFAASGAGDVNGDGFSDLLVGAKNNDTGWSDGGTAYLVLGPVTGDIDLGSADARLLGENSGDHAGWSVSGAGDVNGDGYEDVLVGALDCDAGASSSGAAYLVHGPVTGDVDLASADARLIGENAGDGAGSSVSDAGDVDGDGFDDLLVGAGRDDQGGQDAGAAYLVLGPVSGDLDLSSAEAKLYCDQDDCYSAQSVSGAGDMDGDGLDDALIGASYHDAGGNASGAAFLIF